METIIQDNLLKVIKSKYFNLAGVVGIEPTTAVLETDIIPFNYTPMSVLLYFILGPFFCQYIIGFVCSFATFFLPLYLWLVILHKCVIIL